MTHAFSRAGRRPLTDVYCASLFLSKAPHIAAGCALLAATSSCSDTEMTSFLDRKVFYQSLAAGSSPISISL
jgi:hypothetical protein